MGEEHRQASPGRMGSRGGPVTDTALGGLLRDARTEREIARTERAGWLSQAADHDDHLVAMLLTLAEAQTRVSIETTGGRQVVGTIALVADDVIGVRTTTGDQVLVALAHTGAIVTHDDGLRPTGDRPATPGASFAQILGALAEEGARVRVVTGAGGPGVIGTVVSCGRDVLTLRLEGTGRHAIVGHRAIADLTVEDRLF